MPKHRPKRKLIYLTGLSIRKCINVNLRNVCSHEQAILLIKEKLIST